MTIEYAGPLLVAVIGSRRPLDGVWVTLAAAGIVLLADPGGAAVGSQPSHGGDGRDHRDRHVGAGLQLVEAEHGGPVGGDVEVEWLLDGAVRQMPSG